MITDISGEGLSGKISSYIQKSLGRQVSDKEIKGVDYDEYELTKKEIVFFSIQGIMLMVLISYVFYRSAFAMIFLMPLIFPFLNRKRMGCIKKRKNRLTLQFREMMHSVTAGLRAGYSIENAFERSYDDLMLLYGKDEMLTIEAEKIKRGL